MSYERMVVLLFGSSKLHQVQKVKYIIQLIEIVTYKNATEYLDNNLSFLESEEVINSLLIGTSMSCGKLENDATLYLSVKIFGEIRFTCIKTVDRDLLVFGDIDSIDTLAAGLIDHFINEEFEIPGIIGPKDIVERLVEYWKQKPKVDYKIGFNQLVYALQKINHIPKLEGELKRATIEDLSLISSWFHLFLIEALNEDDEEVANEVALRKIKNEEVYIWFNKTKVAMASIARPTNNGVTINYVYTPQSQRANGYGTKLVAELSYEMLEKGYKFCTLFTNLDNPTSNNIYKKIGYKSVKEFISIKFTKSTDSQA